MSNDIATKLQAILIAKGDIKDAIESKGVTVGNAALYEYASKIEQIGGGGEVTDDIKDPNKVCYIDHTGTIHYKYTLDEFLELTEEPSNPPFSGLVPTGWEISLADAQEFVRENGFGPVICQTYTTDDGSTRIYIDIEDDFMLKVPITYSGLSNANKNKLKIDWGDGTEMSQSSATTGVVYHEYAQKGSYCIRYIPEEGINYKPFNNSSYPSFFGYYYVSTPYAFEPLIRKIEFGNCLSGHVGNLVARQCESVSVPYGCGFGVNGIGFGVPYVASTNFGTTTSAPYNARRLECCIIPRGVVSTGSFANCVNLKKIILPSTITTTLPTFSNCFNLTCVNIPSGVTTLGNSVFNNCYSLERVNLPNSISSIGTSSFSNCFNLTCVNIPSGVTSLGNNFCSGCWSLAEIEMPSGITSGGTSIFSYCYSLKSLKLSQSLTSLGASFCTNCWSLAEIEIPDSVIDIGNSAFQECNSLSSVTFSNSLQTIGSYAFSNCRKLTSITLPNTLKTIGLQAFFHCSLLTGTINIPEGVTTIGNNAFEAATFYVSEIILPSTLTNLGSNTFNCNYYSPDAIPDKIIRVRALTPPTAGGSIFGSLSNNKTKMKIYVPSASVNAYKAASGWSTYATIIEAEPGT